MPLSACGPKHSMLKRRLDKAILLSSCLILSGCWSAGQDFSAFKSSILETLRFSSNAQQSDFINQNLIHDTESKDAEPLQSMGHWWENLNDPVLNGYIERLLNQNLSLIQASERVIQAREELISTNADFLPTLGADSSASRSFAPNATTNQRSYSNSYTAGSSISWLIDLFGKLRRSAESKRAQLESTAYERDALAQTLIADLFNQRIAVSVQNEIKRLTDDIKTNRQDILTLLQRRYNMGAQDTALSDVYSAEQNLDAAKSDTHDSEIASTQALYALDVLLGDKPGSNPTPDTSFALSALPPIAPQCLPASLLDRRPDLRAARASLKAANANVGVAIADLYPSLDLSGTLGFSGDSTNSLLSAQQLAGSILSSLSATLYQGGALRANIRSSESALRESEAAYGEAILNALVETENALKAKAELTRKLEVTQAQLSSAKKTAKITNERYNKGISSLSEVLNVKRSALQLEITALQTHQDLWNAHIALYLALGGDWLQQNQYSTCTHPTDNKNNHSDTAQEQKS